MYDNVVIRKLCKVRHALGSVGFFGSYAFKSFRIELDSSIMLFSRAPPYILEGARCTRKRKRKKRKKRKQPAEYKKKKEKEGKIYQKKLSPPPLPTTTTNTTITTTMYTVGGGK